MLNDVNLLSTHPHISDDLEHVFYSQISASLSAKYTVRIEQKMFFYTWKQKDRGVSKCFKLPSEA